MKQKYKIALLSGDGIGPEVIKEGVKVLESLRKSLGCELILNEVPVGGVAYETEGHPLPADTLNVAQEADAVLLGAVGGPRWEKVDFSLRPERALLGLRSNLKLYANLRPAKIFPALVDASSLKRELVDNLDIMVVRELTGGIYFGEPRGVEFLTDGKRRGFNTLVYTDEEIKRIARVAFDVARKRSKRVVSVDKANVLEATGLWREVVTEVHEEYDDVTLEHMYVDNCAMQLVREPKQFDVIVTTNMFGDILSDEASMLTGSIGMLPSASVGGKTAMYEPIHGSAPDIAGKGLANPLATILSIGMMFKYSFGHEEVSAKLESAVESVLNQGIRTRDIMSNKMTEVSTQEMGDRVVAELEK